MSDAASRSLDSRTPRSAAESELASRRAQSASTAAKEINTSTGRSIGVTVCCAPVKA